MKRISFFNFILLLTITLGMVACNKNKNYIIGGVPEDVNMYKNITSYDVLKNDRLYDTLIKIIDAAGFKDKLNKPGVTFFAPSGISIFKYLNARTIEVQKINVYAKFALDSLLYYLSNNINGTADSLGMYLIDQTLPYSMLTNTGAYYPTKLAADTSIVSFEYTRDPSLGYNSIVSSIPQIVYFTYMWKPYTYELSDANPVGNITPDIGVHTRVITSGIMTKTGIIDELENGHVLFFYGMKN
jgi:hypothetical protein